MSALSTIIKRPLGQPTIDAVFAAAKAAKGRAIEVHSLRTGRVHEIGIWQQGEWIGSVFLWNRGDGLGAWSSLGDIQRQARSPEHAVRIALAGDQDGPSRRQV